MFCSLVLIVIAFYTTCAFHPQQLEKSAANVPVYWIIGRASAQFSYPPKFGK